MLFSACLRRLFVTPWTAARQAFLSFAVSQGLLKLRSFESVMPSTHVVLWRLLLLQPTPGGAAVLPIAAGCRGGPGNGLALPGHCTNLDLPHSRQDGGLRQQLSSWAWTALRPQPHPSSSSLLLHSLPTQHHHPEVRPVRGNH